MEPVPDLTVWNWLLSLTAGNARDSTRCMVSGAELRNRGGRLNARDHR
jgi:hypothetical protein